MRCMNNSHSTAKPLIHAQEHKMNPRLLVKETMYQTWKNHPETYPVNMMAQIEQNISKGLILVLPDREYDLLVKK